MKNFALLALLVLAPVFAHAQSAPPEAVPEEKVLTDPALEARAKALQKELRCLVCQGQSIDDSNAPLALDLRRLLREQIEAGASDDEIKDFLVARYGAFVLMKPPLRADTAALWFGPLLLVVLGGAVVAVTVLRARRRAKTEDADLSA